MKRDKVHIGCVMIHAAGSNPYTWARDVGCIGENRVRILRAFRDTGKLPAGFALWDDNERQPITSPAEIDWNGMRS